MRLCEFIEAFEKVFPLQWAMPGDKVGLLCGDTQRGIEKILLALDATDNVLKEAVDYGADLLLTHHPPMRKDFASVATNDRHAKKIYYAIQHDLAIYSAHTNVDFAPNGVSAILANLLNVKRQGFLNNRCNEKLFKFAVFVPEKHLEKFRKSLLDIGIGKIGNYSYCSFSSSGEGTFLPLAGTNPFIGEIGKLEKVSEIRFETIVPQHLVAETIDAIHRFHPYEEPAFDIYPLENSKINGGFGIVGNFEATFRLGDIIERCREKLPTNCISYIGRAEKMVKKVAVLGGCGDHFIDDVISSAVDVFITGEINHHSALALNDADISAILPGHFATEWIILPRIKEIIGEIYSMFSKRGHVNISESEQSIFQGETVIQKYHKEWR